MNFSRAVKRPLTRSGAIRDIYSQSELELGRPLTKIEEANLLSKFSPQTILERVQKVNASTLFLCF